MALVIRGRAASLLRGSAKTGSAAHYDAHACNFQWCHEELAGFLQ